MSDELPPIIPDQSSGYMVPVEYGETRIEAARSLVEEYHSDPSTACGEVWSRAGLIALGRTARPWTNAYFVAEFDDGSKWYKSDPHDSDVEWDFAFDGWFFDCAYAHLEECIEEQSTLETTP